MNILIIVPHPDDEVLGFGGIIQKHTEKNDNVLVQFIIEIKNRKPKDQIGLENQIDQSIIVGKKLGYNSKVYEVKLNDENFSQNVRYVSNIIEDFKPDILYSVFGGDNHQDHEYIFKIIRVATRVWSNFLIKKIYLGEILSSTDQSPKLPQFAFIPTYYVPLTKKQVEMKIECMKDYEEEVRNWPHPRSEKGIINKAESRGSECGYEYAEAFITLRNIDNL